MHRRCYTLVSLVYCIIHFLYAQSCTKYKLIAHYCDKYDDEYVTYCCVTQVLMHMLRMDVKRSRGWNLTSGNLLTVSLTVSWSASKHWVIITDNLKAILGQNVVLYNSVFLNLIDWTILDSYRVQGGTNLTAIISRLRPEILFPLGYEVLAS